MFFSHCLVEITSDQQSEGRHIVLCSSSLNYLTVQEETKKTKN